MVESPPPSGRRLKRKFALELGTLILSIGFSGIAVAGLGWAYGYDSTTGRLLVPSIVVFLVGVYSTFLVPLYNLPFPHPPGWLASHL